MGAAADRAHRILLSILLLATLCESDSDLLLDYCVADTAAAASFHLNGLPCIDPAAARAEHFATSALSQATSPGATLFGFNVTATSPGASLPGANAQGLSMARIDLASGGVAPPHSHPRASEVALVLAGSVLVGFADTSYRLYTQVLRAGEAFVFPKAMVHFLYNMDAAEPATVLSGLNSQSPGAQLVPFSAFRTEPPMPDEVLKKAFKIHGQEVHRIQRNLDEAYSYIFKHVPHKLTNARHSNGGPSFSVVLDVIQPADLKRSILHLIPDMDIG